MAAEALKATAFPSNSKSRANSASSASEFSIRTPLASNFSLSTSVRKLSGISASSRPPTYYKKSRHHPELFPPELFLILLYVHLHDIRPMYCGVQMVIFHVIRVEKSTFSSVFVWFMGILLLWCYHSSFSFFLFFISFIAFFTTFFTEFPSYSLNNNFL